MASSSNQALPVTKDVEQHAAALVPWSRLKQLHSMEKDVKTLRDKNDRLEQELKEEKEKHQHLHDDNNILQGAGETTTFIYTGQPVHPLQERIDRQEAKALNLPDRPLSPLAPTLLPSVIEKQPDLTTLSKTVILSALPQRIKRQAAALLDRIGKSNQVYYTADGQVYINGVKFGSHDVGFMNIIGLLQHTFGRKQKLTPGPLCNIVTAWNNHLVEFGLMKKPRKSKQDIAADCGKRSVEEIAQEGSGEAHRDIAQEGSGDAHRPHRSVSGLSKARSPNDHTKPIHFAWYFVGHGRCVPPFWPDEEEELDETP